MAKSAYSRGSVALGFVLVLFSAPAAVRAADLDIPRLQADAQRGSVKQEIELGTAYFAGRGVPQDEKLAAYWYEKAANAGDPWAQKQIGYFYETGTGVERDPAQAVRWYERAAAGGMISAKVNLGVAYLLGDGIRKDPALAEELFHRAYAQGSGMAACYLGEMYMQGLGVKRDEAAGEHWYEAGAKRHDPRAEFQLGSVLWNRHKNAGEQRRAVKLLREAATAGMVAAKHQLGIVLLKHPELGSKQEGPALLKEASEAGEWRSSMALGLTWRDGMAGVKADPRTAYYHYRVAALQGGQEALGLVANELDALSAQLGDEQRAAIDADAQAWFAGHHLSLGFVGKNGARDYPVYAVATQRQRIDANPLIHFDPSVGFVGGPIHRLSVN